MCLAHCPQAVREWVEVIDDEDKDESEGGGEEKEEELASNARRQRRMAGAAYRCVCAYNLNEKFLYLAHILPPQRALPHIKRFYRGARAAGLSVVDLTVVVVVRQRRRRRFSVSPCV